MNFNFRLKNLYETETDEWIETHWVPFKNAVEEINIYKSVENDGIGFYDAGGFRGYDPGTNYLVIEHENIDVEIEIDTCWQQIILKPFQESISEIFCSNIDWRDVGIYCDPELDPHGQDLETTAIFKFINFVFKFLTYEDKESLIISTSGVWELVN